MNYFFYKRVFIRLALFCVGATALLSAPLSCKQHAEIASPGQIHVTSTPSEAMVLLGNVHKGKTPITLMSVPPGQHLLVLRKPGYHEVRTTILVYPGERIATEINMNEITGLLLIHSDPSVADVEINNSSYGKTPLLLPQIPLGQHQIKVSATGYIAKTIDVNIPDRTPQKIDVSLVSDSALVVISSTPPGANIVIDSIARGTTPYTIDKLTSGKYHFSVTMRGYAHYSDSFTVHPGEDREIDITLTPLPGTLAVISNPTGARVYINDQLTGETPFSIANIPSGKYVVRTELRGYESIAKTNTVVHGEKTTFEFDLVKNSGLILISTEPPNVRVYMDGKDHGTTELIEQEPISTQMEIDFVPQGNRMLQLTKSGYFDIIKTLEVLPNRTLVIHEKLTLRPVPFIPNVIIRTGSGPEHTFKGVIRRKYANGVIQLEIEPGIFRSFEPKEIISKEPIIQK